MGVNKQNNEKVNYKESKINWKIKEKRRNFAEKKTNPNGFQNRKIYIEFGFICFLFMRNSSRFLFILFPDQLGNFSVVDRLRQTISNLFANSTKIIP